MPDGHKSRMDQRSLLWIALGRQRVGKTALLNAAVQYFRALGCHIEIWNADQQNRTHSLSTFFADAAVPPAGGLADGKLWIEGQLVDQVNRRYHAVLDAGGGWTGFSSLIEDVPVIQALAQQGTDVIGLFCVGPEQADLAYLGHFRRAARSCRRKRSSCSTQASSSPADQPAERSQRYSKILPSRPPSSVELRSS